MADETGGYLLTKDLEHILGVSQNMVYKLIGAGKLHPRKIGNTLLFDPAEVAKLKAERRKDYRVSAWKKRKAAK